MRKSGVRGPKSVVRGPKSEVRGSRLKVLSFVYCFWKIVVFAPDLTM